MKSALLIITLLSSPSLFANEKEPSYVSESQSITETFSTKITKVYSVKSDGYEYISYAINWRGQEAVVTQQFSGAESNKYNVGDTVRCVMQQHAFPKGASTKGRITFILVRSDGITSAGADAAAEVRARRLMRQTNTSPDTKEKAKASDIKEE